MNKSAREALAAQALGNSSVYELAYRKWLIGQIAAGTASLMNEVDTKLVAKWTVELADEIIREIVRNTPEDPLVRKPGS